MSIGAGIAILGAWMFSAACATSDRVSGLGLVLSMVVVVAVTCLIIFGGN